VIFCEAFINVLFKAIRVLGTFSTTWNLKGNKFIGLGALYGGAIYCENPLAVIISINDVYAENTAINGGAIAKNSLGKNDMSYDRPNFLNSDSDSDYSCFDIVCPKRYFRKQRCNWKGRINLS